MKTTKLMTLVAGTMILASCGSAPQKGSNEQTKAQSSCCGSGETACLSALMATISGEINGWEASSDSMLLLLPFDFVDMNARENFNVKKGDGKFTFTFPMTHKHDIALSFGMKPMMAMLAPGDSLFVSFDAATGDAAFSGANAELNNEVNKAFKSIVTEMQDVFNLNFNGSAQDMVSQVKTKLTKIDEILTTYQKDNKLSPEAKAFIAGVLKYSLGTAMANYRFDEGPYSTERLKVMTDEIFNIYNPANSEIGNFGVFANSMYYSFRNSNTELAAELEKDSAQWDKAKIMDLLLKHTLTLEKSTLRDVMLSAGITHMAVLFEGQPFEFSKDYLNADMYANPAFMEVYVRSIIERK